MTSAEERTWRRREGLLALGFLLLMAAAAWTVAVPELTKEPEGGKPAATPVGPAPTKGT